MWSWLLGKALGFLGGDVVGTVTGAITKYHADTLAGEAVKATLEAKRDEINAQAKAAILGEWAKSTKFAADAAPFIVWVCGISLAATLVPRALLTAYFWAVSTIRTGTIQPYPDTGDILHIIGVVLGLVLIGSAKEVLKK